MTRHHDPQRIDGLRWVFAYGSLMWNPGFEYVNATPAIAFGVHRSLCIYSIRYRGTRRRPGLVLGLDRGGSCIGMAFRVSRSQWSKTLAYLRARELFSGVYREHSISVRLREAARTSPRCVPALAYLADPTHSQYAGAVPLGERAETIRGARGTHGPNIDYVIRTLAHLEALGVNDRELASVLQVPEDEAVLTIRGRAPR